MPEFISDVIYGLKHEYGSRLKLMRTTAATADILTGEKTKTKLEITVNKAIRLPNQLSLEFIQKIAGMRGLESLVGTFKILLDRKDVPSNFEFRVGEISGQYNNRDIELRQADIFDEAVILHVVDINGATSL